MDFMRESTTAKSSSDRAHIITTGKRMDLQTTACSSFGFVETSSSSYGGGGMSSEEEEDMANCLIMLAYSDKPDVDHYQKTDKLKLRSVTEMTTTCLEGNSSLHNYECKTCNRAFPSFQALGGHRASHKKPKITIDQDKNFGSIKTEFSKEDQPEFQLHYEENKIVTTSNNKKGKIHECSICGSEFLSGQALGGHMRRHRAPLPSTNNQMNDTSALHSTQEKSLALSIDLNLPAPEVVDDVHSSSHFTATTSSSQRPLVFSTVALVDCHY